MGKFILAAAALGVLAIPGAPAGAQYWGGGYGGYRDREIRQELRECRRELRHADSRREYRRELRECHRELRQARHGDYYDRYHRYDRGYHSYYGRDRRYWDGYRWRYRW